MATQAPLAVDDNDPTERIAVLRSDLEQWQSALRWAYGLSSAFDLADNYRAGRPNMKQSKLTRLAGASHNRIGAYLDEGISEDELLPE